MEMDNESAGIIGRGTDARAAFQVPSSTTEGTTSDNGVVGTEVEREVGVINGDNQVSSKVQAEGISNQGISEDEEALNLYVTGSRDKGLAAYNALTIERVYPKTWGKIMKHCEQLANGSEQLDKETVMGLLLAAPRTILPGFFDENGIYVNTEFSNKWAFDIKTKNTMEHSAFKYESRVLAESDGFDRAFEILEEKL